MLLTLLHPISVREVTFRYGVVISAYFGALTPAVTGTSTEQTVVDFVSDVVSEKVTELINRVSLDRVSTKIVKLTVSDGQGSGRAIAARTILHQLSTVDRLPI